MSNLPTKAKRIVKGPIVAGLALIMIVFGGCQDTSPSEGKTRKQATQKLEDATERVNRGEGASTLRSATEKRPPKWAQPVRLQGVPNLHRVTQHLYRSAQPTAEGMKNLKKMGIETIVNLRSFHSDRDEIGDTGLAYEHIYMKAWHAEEEDVVRFLQTVTNEKRTPALVHCHYGADRTGMVCAVHRIVVCGWSKDEAIREMTQGGFGYHTVWSNLIRYIENLDVDSIKKKAGIAQEKHDRSMNTRTQQPRCARVACGLCSLSAAAN